MNVKNLTRQENARTLCRVIADYRIAYPDPIVIRGGDDLIVGKEDAEYPGWVWCSSADGKSGWIPGDYIERAEGNARARYDYTAAELSANAGEELTMIEEKNGWAWCTNSKGQSGWLPVANLEKVV